MNISIDRLSDTRLMVPRTSVRDCCCEGTLESMILDIGYVGHVSSPLGDNQCLLRDNNTVTNNSITTDLTFQLYRCVTVVNK